MNRRKLVTLASSLATLPLPALAQSSPDIPKIGFVYPGPKAAAASRIDAMMSGLRISGYPRTRIELVVRTSEGDPGRIAPMIAETIASNVNLIVAVGSPVLHPARSATQTIPIVAIDLESDPVASGAARTVVRPGGNVTGVFLDFPDFAAKWVEILIACAPGVRHLAAIWDSATGNVQIDSVRRAAGSLGIRVDTMEARNPSDLVTSLRAATENGAKAAVILSSPLVPPNMPALADLALQLRLPCITLFPDFARIGGLLAYGPTLLSMYRQIGVMCGKVLGGVKPAELPVERPTKFEMVLNLRTAFAMDVNIPASILLRADEVIE